MSTNLRLNDEVAEALREASIRTGRAQQDLIRDALRRFLGLAADDTARRQAISLGLVAEPAPFRDVSPSITLRGGLTTRVLLARDSDR